VAPPTADLFVEKSGVPGTVAVGDAVTYTITVTNLGPDTATAVVLTEEFDTEFVPIPGTGHVVSRFALFAVGDIVSGDSVSVTITGTYLLTGTFRRTTVGPIPRRSSPRSSSPQPPTSHRPSPGPW
jgi:uncharacterized repeat protein (TIGR01451 family)